MQCINFTIDFLFAAQAYGIDFGITALLTVIITILIYSISSPAAPMEDIFTLTMIFNTIGLPVAVINLIKGIFNIIDMFITLNSSTCNGICTSIIAYQYDSFDMDKFNEKKADN